MKKLLISWIITVLLSLFPLVNGCAAAQPRTKEAVSKPIDENDPIEQAFKRIMEMDDAAQDAADKMIQEAKTGTEPQARATIEATLGNRIDQRFSEVKKAYEEFLRRHPKHARAHLAYGSFLYDIQEEEEGVKYLEKARKLDPTDPAAWNNLANHYGHRGPVKKAFEYYAKAIELKPDEPVYLQNLATSVYLFRKDGQEYYGITEQEIFDKALDLYRRAIKLDPTNFVLANDYAQSYYGIKPLRAEEALKAWDHALKAAGDAIEREGTFLHMARVELNSGRFDDARRHLNMVTNQMYETLKARLTRNLNEKESKDGQPAASSVSQP